MSQRESWKNDLLLKLADYVTLLYHEARNVRHLVKQGLIEKEPWKNLIALPTNRNEAWAAIQSVRQEARSASTVAQLLRVFERRFHVSLELLLEMYKNPNWRHAKEYGGNAWAEVAETVLELAQHIENGKKDRSMTAIEVLMRAQHNTGTVGEKLVRLDSSLRQNDAGIGA